MKTVKKQVLVDLVLDLSEELETNRNLVSATCQSLLDQVKALNLTKKVVKVDKEAN
jgi:hypothetical protein